MRQRAGQRHDGALGGGIIEQRLVALIGRDRSGVDDAAATFHVRKRVLDHVEEAEHVGAERLLDLLGFELAGPRDLMLLARVVDQASFPDAGISLCFPLEKPDYVC